MKLGISTYALTWAIGVPGYPTPVRPIDAMDLLRVAKDHAIHVVQFADNLPLHVLAKDELDRLRSTACDWDIQLEIGTRGTEPEHLLEYLGLAIKLDCPFVRTLITTPGIDTALTQIRQVLPQFEEAGVVLAIENHGLHTTKQLVSLFESLPKGVVGCCLDTVNSLSALDTPDVVLRDLGPHTVNLHVKDFDIRRVDHQMGFLVLGTPAGCGKLDVSHVLSTLAEFQRDPSVILELWTPFTNTVEETIELEWQWFEKSLLYLKMHHFKDQGAPR